VAGEPEDRGAAYPPDESGSLAEPFAPSKGGSFAARSLPMTESARPGGAAAAEERSVEDSAVGREGEADRPMRERVAALLEEVRPFINADGGDVELVSVRDGVVRVRMHGACEGCASAPFTLQFGIERRLMEEIPGVRRVEIV